MSEEPKASDAEYKPGEIRVFEWSGKPMGSIHIVTQEEEDLYETVYGPFDEEGDDE